MLRIGVILDFLQPSAWVAHVLDQVQNGNFARLHLLLLTSPNQRSSEILPVSSKQSPALFRRYELWDYRHQNPKPDAQRATDLTKLLQDIPTLTLKPGQSSSSPSLSSDELTAARSANLELLLNFSSEPLPADLFNTARFGIWSLRHGSNQAQDPPLFWEIHEHNPVSETTLQAQNSPTEPPKVLYCSASATNQRSLSANRNPIYWKSAEILVRCLRELHQRGWPYLEHRDSRIAPPSQSQTSPKILTTPTMARFLAGQFRRAVRDSLHSRRLGGYTQWFLALRRRSAAQPFTSAAGYKPLPVPHDRFYADPILVDHDGKTWLFFEDFPYSEPHAFLSCCELAPDGTPGEPFEILRRPYHLSYPFIFEHTGQMYMIPETRGNNAVELYRAEDFPRRWVFDKALLENVAAVDATIHHDGERFWMFAGLSSGRYSTCDELAIFFSDALHGPWQPHPANPVVSDVRRARPAGAIFRENGRLIRPSQDCAKAYGWGLNFSEIVILTETDYEERFLGQITPDWLPGNLGTHTYNRNSQFEVIDANFPKKLPKASS